LEVKRKPDMNGLSNLNELLQYSVQKCLTKTAFVFGPKRITFAELGELSQKMARGLSEQGVTKGDRVALILRNCMEVPIILFGTVRIGAIPTFLNAQHKGGDIFHALSNCEPKILFVEDSLYPGLKEEIRKIPSIQRIYGVLGAGESPGSGLLEPFDSCLKNGDASAEVREDDIAAIVYTAGTEGRPKGAMLSHEGVLVDCFDRSSIVKIDSEIKTLILAPFYHIAGFRHLLMTIYRGNTTYVIPFQAEKVLKLIHEERIGFTVGTPATYHLMFKREDFQTYDLSSLKVVGVGGAPCTPEFARRLFGTFPQALFYNGYGQTELTGGNIVNVGEEFKRRPESVGRIAKGHELRVVNEEGQPLPPKKMGEVVVRGKYVFKGYWRMPEATAQKIRGGWLYTGDLGWLDEEGFLYLAGRKSDMIIRGGENIYPQEVENCLEQHPAVAEAAVIAVPDEVMGEEVKAVVSLRRGMRLEAEDLREFCRSKMAKFKVPRFIEFVEELPHVSAGKIDRKALRGSSEP
jgi:acyl-CoA synthetase (AMP-forming)/AMP-acid ligase II